MDRRDFLGVASGHLVGALGAITVGARWKPLSAAAQAPAPVIGINAHILTDEYIRHLRTLGVRHVRTTLLWPLWQENVQAYRVAWDEVVERSTDAGLRLLVVAHNWPADRPVVASAVNRGTMDRFADFIADQARRYPAVEAWQLWNEQDLWVQAPFGAGRGLPMRGRGERYAEQLRMAYPRMKQANGRAIVVTGGTAEVPGSGFLEGMMDGDPQCDAVAIHAYGPWEQARARILTARRIVGPDARLWVTECGSRSHEVSESRQLADWSGTIEGNERERLAERLYPYALLAGEWGHSLIGPNGSPRPTYQWLRAHLRERRG